MPNLMEHHNPYAAPQSDRLHELLQPSRSSKVTPCALIGAIMGAGFQAVIQMIIVGKPTPITSLDNQYFITLEPLDMVAMIFWAIVVGTICAILGSIVGALLDTFYSANVECIVGADTVDDSRVQ